LFLYFLAEKMAVDTERYATFTFGGVEYTVSLSVQNGSQLTVQVEEHTSTDQWRNMFDANCELSAVLLRMSLVILVWAEDLFQNVYPL